MTNTVEMDESETKFFRCPVAAECGKATLVIKDRDVQALVEEASITGFTVTLDDAYFDQARERECWTLKFDGRVLEVVPETVSNPDDGRIRVWLKQVKDLTEFEEIRFFSWKTFFRNRACALSRKAVVLTSGLGVITAALLMFFLQPPPKVEEASVQQNPFLQTEMTDEGPSEAPIADTAEQTA